MPRAGTGGGWHIQDWQARTRTGLSSGPHRVCGASPPRRRIVGAAATRLPRTIHRCDGRTPRVHRNRRGTRTVVEGRASIVRSGNIGHAAAKKYLRDIFILCPKMLRPTPPRVWKSRDKHAPPRRVIQLYYAQGCFGPASAFSGASASNFRWMRRTASWSPRL